MRICSLLPGATEVLAALGVAEQLVAVSHECDYPPEVRGKPILIRPRIDPDHASSAEIDSQVRASVSERQDLYSFDSIGFTQVAPDLVIAQDLCDVCAITPRQLQAAMQALPKPPQLLSLAPHTLADVLRDMERIGTAIGRPEQGAQFVATLRCRLTAIEQRLHGQAARPKVGFLEWLDPLYVGGHWVPEMVTCAGGVDVLGTAGQPSRQIAWSELLAAEPEILLLAPCGFSVPRTMREVSSIRFRPQWAALPAVRDHHVFSVDAGAYFSRPGPRLVDGVELLAQLLHPSVFGAPDGEGRDYAHISAA